MVGRIFMASNEFFPENTFLMFQSLREKYDNLVHTKIPSIVNEKYEQRKNQVPKKLFYVCSIFVVLVLVIISFNIYSVDPLKKISSAVFGPLVWGFGIVAVLYKFIVSNEKAKIKDALVAEVNSDLLPDMTFYGFLIEGKPRVKQNDVVVIKPEVRAEYFTTSWKSIVSIFSETIKQTGSANFTMEYISKVLEPERDRISGAVKDELANTKMDLKELLTVVLKLGAMDDLILAIQADADILNGIADTP